MELTEQQKQHICAELARAMGWDFIASSSEIALPGDGEWYTPFGRAYGNEPPDPFTDAAASRALVEWATESDRRSADFFKALCILLDIIPTWIEGYSGPVYSPSEVKRIMTAPLETIALAAARALGIMPDASNAPEDVARGNKERS